jgi:hypothetical protein
MSVGSLAGCTAFERTRSCTVRCGTTAWVRLQVIADTTGNGLQRGMGYNWLWDTTGYRIQLGYEPQLALATTGYGLQLDMGYNWIWDTSGYATMHGLQLGGLQQGMGYK